MVEFNAFKSRWLQSQPFIWDVIPPTFHISEMDDLLCSRAAIQLGPMAAEIARQHVECIIAYETKVQRTPGLLAFEESEPVVIESQDKDKWYMELRRHAALAAISLSRVLRTILRPMECPTRPIVSRNFLTNPTPLATARNLASFLLDWPQHVRQFLIAMENIKDMPQLTGPSTAPAVMPAASSSAISRSQNRGEVQSDLSLRSLVTTVTRFSSGLSSLSSILFAAEMIELRSEVPPALRDLGDNPRAPAHIALALSPVILLVQRQTFTMSRFSAPAVLQVSTQATQTISSAD
jgi:hypothetical protein